MDDDSRKPDGADGWVDPYAQTEFGLQAVGDSPEAPESSLTPATRNKVDDGKPMALLSHASVLLGMPLFIIPMMQRDNEFALNHAKAASVNFIFFVVAVALTALTCGLAFPLIFLVYVPMLIGFVDAMNGRRASSLAWGPSGERMFPGVQVDDRRNLLE